MDETSRQGMLVDEAQRIAGTLRIINGDLPGPGECSKPCTIPTNPVVNWGAVHNRCLKIESYADLADNADVYAALYQATVSACSRAQEFVPKVTADTSEAQNHEWAQQALGNLPAALDAAKAAG